MPGLLILGLLAVIYFATGWVVAKIALVLWACFMVIVFGFGIWEDSR